MQVGEVGEIESADSSETSGELDQITIEQNRMKSNVELPQEIYSTTGTILKVRDDSLIVSGDGSNFADNKQRELTIYFTEQTKTFTKDAVKHQGMVGMDVLSENMNILINSSENIRGKTSFTIKTISILN